MQTVRRTFPAIILSLTVLGNWAASSAPPTPLLRLTFDRQFAVDGAESATVEPVPAGRFVEGVVGQAFVPAEDVRLRAAHAIPAPEGTVSLWVKPVNYEADWAGGELLFAGKIGPFLTGVMKDAAGEGPFSLQARLYRHDCCSGLHWAEYWTWPAQGIRSTGPNAPFSIWRKDTWRLLTVVWCAGERRVYFDGVLMQRGTAGEGDVDDYIAPAATSNNYLENVGRSTPRISRSPTIPGTELVIPAGSKAVDELLVWDCPLTDAQVAALFFARVAAAGLRGAVQQVPAVAGDPVWPQAVHSATWVEPVSCMAVEAADTLALAHRDGRLYVRYREPMPADYINVRTLLGGAMLRRSTTEHDADVWADDCVAVRLSPDAGRTTYVLAVSASGAQYDARNGDAAFTAPPGAWTVRQTADAHFWTVEMEFDLPALAGGGVPSEVEFNLTRTVRQQGYAVRQWSPGMARLVLHPAGVTANAVLQWAAGRGRLAAAVDGVAAGPLTAKLGLRPLEHTAVLPDDTDVNTMVQQAGRDQVPPPEEITATLAAGKLGWSGHLDYAERVAALAVLTVTDATGAVVAARSCLVSGSDAVSMRRYNLPSRGELVVQLLLASESLAGPDVTGEVTVTPAAGGDPVRRQAVEGFADITQAVTLDVADLPVGAYRLQATLRTAEAPLGQCEAAWFHSGPPPWLGNDVGIVTTVPAPWTPVTVNGDTVGVWGREHRFTKSLLPVSMQVLDEELLAGPMRLLIRTAAGTLDTAVAATPLLATDAAGVRARLTGRAVGAGVVVELTGTMEFDGFADLAFTVRPAADGKAVAIDSIAFEAPFRRQCATLYDDSNYNMFDTHSGAIPAAGMAVGATDTVRVGNARQGVQFYPFLGTVGKSPGDTPLTLTPDGDVVRLRYVVSGGVTVSEPLTLKLGFIGTPVKPRNLRRLRRTAHAGPKVPADLQAKGYSSARYWFSNWTNFNGGSGSESGYFNYTPQWCRGLAESRLPEWQEDGMYSLLKIQPGLITAHSPEYALFWKEWGGRYFDDLAECELDLGTYPGATVRPPGIWTQVDWTQRSWQDFYFYSLDKVLAAYEAAGVRVGVYVDCTHHDGDPGPYRQWVQRLYQVVRQHSPDGLIVIHMSGDRRMAVWGMADLLAEGEQYTAGWMAYIADKPELTFNDCHPTVLPLDRVQATYAGTLWGPQPVFLSQFWTDKRQGEDVYRKEHGEPAASYCRRMRYSTGLMLAHDAYWWGEFYACGVTEEPWLRRARWGYDETAEFIPYWDPRKLLEIQGPAGKSTVVSAWLRPDGGLMAIVLNTANEPATVSLRVNTAAFPVPLKPFTALEDITSPVAAFAPEAQAPTRFPYRNGVAEIAMEARDFRLLVFE